MTKIKEDNMNNQPTSTQENCPIVKHKIGHTTYIVKVHFSDTATETMSDKIKRLLQNEVVNM